MHDRVFLVTNVSAVMLEEGMPSRMLPIFIDKYNFKSRREKEREKKRFIKEGERGVYFNHSRYGASFLEMVPVLVLALERSDKSRELWKLPLLGHRRRIGAFKVTRSRAAREPGKQLGRKFSVPRCNVVIKAGTSPLKRYILSARRKRGSVGRLSGRRESPILAPEIHGRGHSPRHFSPTRECVSNGVRRVTAVVAWR